MELEQLKEKIVLKSQRGVHKGTNFENLSIRVTNKS